MTTFKALTYRAIAVTLKRKRQIKRQLVIKEQLINPVTKPRYDDVYYQGMKWLDSL